MVLPGGSFAASQLEEPRDEQRRCVKCAGLLRCARCEVMRSGTEFSWAQQRKPAASRRCNVCLRGAALRPSRGGGLALEAFTGFGAQAYWDWMLVLRRVLLRLPEEVLPLVRAFLGETCGAHGVVHLGGKGVCAICDVSWPCTLQTVAAHRSGRRHRGRLEECLAARAAASECAEAARACGLLEEALAAEAARAAALAAAASLPVCVEQDVGCLVRTMLRDPSGLARAKTEVISPRERPPGVGRRRWGRCDA